MAYNNINKLILIRDIQNIILERQAMGDSNETIYHTYIYPTYHISRRSFYNYMGINAKAKLRKLLEKTETELHN